MKIEELADLVEKEFIEVGLWKEEYADSRRKWFLQTLELIRDRFHTLKDFARAGRAYFADDFDIDEKSLQKNVIKQPGLKEWLPELAKRYESLEAYTLEETEREARELAEKLNIKPGVIINGMRTVITGQLAGPSLFDILMVIGRDKVIERLNAVGNLY
jgi:glutamyl-tRNA synthetase